MEIPGYKIFPLGENALTVEFGNSIDERINDLVIAIADSLSGDPFEGFVECVPAYSSLTIFYNSAAVSESVESAYAFVAGYFSKFIPSNPKVKSVESDPFEIPVDFSKEAAPDLEFVASRNGLDIETVIKIFTESTYRVFMLGFLPGFPYMGTVDLRIAAPRLETPRMRVPKGSVGIAGRQTGVYPLESPGGWRLIGRTDVELFTPDKDTPALLSPGSSVKFVQS